MNACIFLLLAAVQRVRCCPDNPSDIVLLAKASYYLTEEQWASVKALAIKIAGSLRLGRQPTDFRFGVAVFDNTNDVRYPIELDMFGRSTDLVTAISQLNIIPCGTWCVQHKSDEQQLQSFISKVRASKQEDRRSLHIIVLSLTVLDEYQLQGFRASNPDVVIQQMQLPQQYSAITYNAPYYHYYHSYYDTYRRYADRMQQIYPDMQVAVPANSYPYATEPQNEFSQLDSSNQLNSICFQLTSCYSCYEPSAPASATWLVKSTEQPKVESSIDDGSSTRNRVIKLDKEKTGVIPLPENPKSEDYEYEITADPPGMKINKTPLHDDEESAPKNDSFDHEAEV